MNAFDTARTPLKLQGPRGNGIARSHFAVLPEAKIVQWVAFGADGAVHLIVEMPFNMSPFCDSATGALWNAREIAASYTARVGARAHRNN